MNFVLFVLTTFVGTSASDGLEKLIVDMSRQM